MIVSINQPAYLPWLGYFHRIAASDLHVVLDHVQFEKNSFTNRNRVRTAAGWCWLTVPVETKGKFGDLAINGLAIAGDGRWQEKHWRTLSQGYSKSPFFEPCQGLLEDVYGRSWKTLGELCRYMTKKFLDELGITTPILFSSELAPNGTKDELILDLCTKTKASVYLSGALGNNYLRESLFTENGIRVEYQDYHHPVYPQPGLKTFEPFLGIPDLLFNCGSQSLDYLMRDQKSLKQEEAP